VREGTIIYERKIQPGPGESSYGIEIASQLQVGDPDFIKKAIKIRRELASESTSIVSTKSSRYNTNLFVDKCEKCGSTKGLHTHHIRPQHKAVNGIIEGQSKNIKENLMVLCEVCHLEVHRLSEAKEGRTK
jgi:5-methylcytosine-specific restriction endonuclease McrA